jgi:hypothetical protein
MSYKGRWTEPTDRTARDEYRELRRELKNPRTKSRRLEIEARLDEMAPNPKHQGTLSSEPPAPPKDWKEALIDRVEATRANGSSAAEAASATSILSPGTPVSSGLSGELARSLDEAKRAVEPQLKAKALHIDDALCTIAEAHAKFGYEIWTGRSDWDELPHDAIVTCQLKHWRNEPVFQRPTWAARPGIISCNSLPSRS